MNLPIKSEITFKNNGRFQIQITPSGVCIHIGVPIKNTNGEGMQYHGIDIGYLELKDLAYFVEDCRHKAYEILKEKT